MINLINNDTVNNLTYLNYFNSISNGETSINANNFTNACNTRWGTGSCLAQISGGGVGGIFMFPNSSKETKTSRTAATNNYRIKALIYSYKSQANLLTAGINSNNTTGTTINSINTTTITGESNTNCKEYAVISNNNFSYCGFTASGDSFLTTDNNRYFISSGWLEDSSFSGSLITRGLYLIIITNSILHSFRPSAENSTTAQNFLTSGNANYSITCLSDTGDGTTPGADLWCTDLWLRDNPSGYAVGRIPHVLLAKGAGFTLGNLYYNPTVIDGVTDQKIWLCCANYGTDKLLMRVWTEDIV